METSQMIDKGTDIIKEAVIKDNNEEYEAALNLYTQGINYLMTAVKYTKKSNNCFGCQRKSCKIFETC